MSFLGFEYNFFKSNKFYLILKNNVYQRNLFTNQGNFFKSKQLFLCVYDTIINIISQFNYDITTLASI